MVTHANGLFGLESRHVRSVAWGNIPDFDRGTDTVSVKMYDVNESSARDLGVVQ